MPCKLRNDMVKILHEVHFDISRKRERQVIFWLRMSRDIQQRIKAYRILHEFSEFPYQHM